jgi:glutamyl-tRNA reductase
MPSVVEKSLQNQKHMHFVGIDVVSKVKDDTLEERMKQIPAALRIIHHDLADFLQWNQKRKYVPYLNVVKGILKRTMTQRSRTSHFPQQQDLNPVSG